ncbi:PITH domain-containing protein [Psilocybe cubensis]|uniref:PITH domain-containing protein n=2 Tax=Psilocybe cubensis TaxID=181762 RepID=A0A8H8CLY4_PSICU|nr:PITH domain-containing protein [Psilocybe cubensis]KAH9481518.1 PITH domain-containing protein [Psilocybe cubensis]
MSHQHHDGCGHESHDHDHDHDHDQSNLGYQDNLFIHIDRQNVVALNAVGNAPNIIKPWHARLDEAQFLESDADDQLIIRIPFTGSVRLKAMLLKAGPEGQTPAKIALFANQESLDFDDIPDKTPTQEFDIPRNREVGEYSLKTAKFSNVSHITVFVPASQGADTSRIYYLGFLGTWTQHKSQPIITVYEAQANIADHEKIQGMDGTWTAPGH